MVENCLTDYQVPENVETLVENIVPASVSQLSFIVQGYLRHAEVLDMLFRDFATYKRSIPLALRRICLTCGFLRYRAHRDLFTNRWNFLDAETAKAGVALEVLEFSPFSGTSWD